MFAGFPQNEGSEDDKQKDFNESRARYEGELETVLKLEEESVTDKLKFAEDFCLGFLCGSGLTYLELYCSLGFVLWLFFIFTCRICTFVAFQDITQRWGPIMASKLCSVGSVGRALKLGTYELLRSCLGFSLRGGRLQPPVAVKFLRLTFMVMEREYRTVPGRYVPVLRKGWSRNRSI